ncbi:MAG: transcriptional regulator LuxR family [Ignavibacteria bacterium]|nr:MAG: transcriptional regulator LuxR family [Ignavibacteria bacterium]KAF0161980.1 MAG: transcriptional regulator LuxR family [Ignavibacteria bacterium]
MNKPSTNIVVFEPSLIVFEGISNIISKSGHHFHLIRTDSLSEIQNHAAHGRFDLAIVNPTLIQNKNKEFASIQKNFPAIIWVALVYNFFDHNLLSQFDRIINITDSAESISKQLTNISSNENHLSLEDEQELLSDREIDVLKQIIKGFSNKEIADHLNISIHTVISHRKNISQKTGIKSQAGLTIYAISNKIILLEDYKN